MPGVSTLAGRAAAHGLAVAERGQRALARRALGAEHLAAAAAMVTPDTEPKLPRAGALAFFCRFILDPARAHAVVDEHASDGVDVRSGVGLLDGLVLLGIARWGRNKGGHDGK